MSFFIKMNEMLDQGWKMTDYSCKACRTNALIDDSKTTFFCCKCNKEIEFQDDEEPNAQESPKEETQPIDHYKLDKQEWEAQN